MPTLLQLTSIHPDAQKRLNEAYELIPAELASIDSQWLAQNAAKVDGIVTGGHLGVPSSLMTALPNLKVIGINGVGFDRIDLDVARNGGVRVANTPDVLTEDVADLADHTVVDPDPRVAPRLGAERVDDVNARDDEAHARLPR